MEKVSFLGEEFGAGFCTESRLPHSLRRLLRARKIITNNFPRNCRAAILRSGVSGRIRVVCHFPPLLRNALV